MESLFLEGLFLQASLIFALGAQNIFVLESGIKKVYPMTISFMCFLCDLTLISIGVIGAGTLFSNYSQVKIVIGVVGVLFLLHYGLSKIFVSEKVQTSSQDSLSNATLKKSILLAITFSILNPHAYLDAFILIGGYSAKYSLLSDRLVVGLGAAFFSLLWFIMLSHAPALMKPIFASNRNLRIISTCSGIILLVLSFKLGQDVYSWIMHGPHSSLAIKSIFYPHSGGLTYTAILY